MNALINGIDRSIKCIFSRKTMLFAWVVSWVMGIFFIIKLVKEEPARKGSEIILKPLSENITGLNLYSDWSLPIIIIAIIAPTIFITSKIYNRRTKSRPAAKAVAIKKATPKKRRRR